MKRFHAIVPAAGCGTRFGADVPKQYLELCGRPLIFHALSALFRCPRIERVWVVLSPDDLWWEQFDWRVFASKLQVIRCGGETRAKSVSNGLAAAASCLTDDDWVLVHDAARPCLSQALLSALLDEVAEDPVGGLLAVPVADTLKRCSADSRVSVTVGRENLWQAQTPQMFRFGLLHSVLAGDTAVTDEAGAVEAAGLQPRLVRSDISNIKVTYPADLHLAQCILKGGLS